MCIHYYPGTGHPVDKKLQLLYDPALHYIYIIYILCERLASGLAWLGLWGRLESYSCQSCGQASYVCLYLTLYHFHVGSCSYRFGSSALTWTVLYQQMDGHDCIICFIFMMIIVIAISEEFDFIICMLMSSCIVRLRTDVGLCFCRSVCLLLCLRSVPDAMRPKYFHFCPVYMFLLFVYYRRCFCVFRYILDFCRSPWVYARCYCFLVHVFLYYANLLTAIVLLLFSAW